MSINKKTIQYIAIGIVSMFVIWFISSSIGNTNTTYKASSDITTNQLKKVIQYLEKAEPEKIKENLVISGAASRSNESIQAIKIMGNSITNRLLEIVKSAEDKAEQEKYLNNNLTFFCNQMVKITLYEEDIKTKVILDTPSKIVNYDLATKVLYPIQIDSKMKSDSSFCIKNIHYFVEED